jgi:hypothetical protein
MVLPLSRAYASSVHFVRRPGKLSLGLLGGFCLLIAAAAAILADKALQPPRSVPDDPIQGDAQSNDLAAGSSTEQSDPFDFSEAFDPTRLTGRQAPDFTLPSIDDGKPVNLRSPRSKPLVLVFGSYDCSVFCHEAHRVEELHQRYKDRAQFLFVQIKAADHAARPLEEDIELAGAWDTHRLARARGVIRALGLTMPSVVDNEDNATRNAYDANPKRMFLVNSYGIIEADSARGMPDGWRVNAFEEELKKHLPAPGM